MKLSSPDEEVRSFWIEHGKACLRIAGYMAEELGRPCVFNIWIPDGMKDTPADRLGPRRRFPDSLDRILAVDYDPSQVWVSLESKLFGIGLESYTVGSAEFSLCYALKNNIICLLDNGHYHPTETVSDKISSLLLFFDKIALHVTRPVRWASDHVVLFDDETCEIAKEIVFHHALNRVCLALDYFDASINRIAAWVLGMRNLQEALLYALLLPKEKMKALQRAGKHTELLVLQQEMKSHPFHDVWNRFCGMHDSPSGMDWLETVRRYEREVLCDR